MPEWRKDPVVDRWIVIATERAKRPTDFRCTPDELNPQSCPLCVGNEEMTPPEILAFREQETAPNSKGWWIRVVPNKFPAVRADEHPSSWWEGIYEVMNGVGAHEVIVETTDHTNNLITQSDKQVEEIIWAWRARSLDLRNDSRLKYICIFKNKGRTAGASLEHAHSQLIATPMVPVDIKQELAGTEAYRAAKGTCVFCDMIHQELAQGQRIVIDSRHFVSIAPYASRFPFEMTILPKQHKHDFGQIVEDEVRDLAQVLRASLAKLAATVCDPPFNMVIHTAPVNAGDASYYHWHIEIMPRLTIMAGFELGTGYFINPTPPELAARALRDAPVVAPHIAEAAAKEVPRYV
ncbi:galactose-1-phosphate uridylyltransferase [Desulforudis sp. 1088]|uniref:galactose-1-phosphate uridylyltransferase n=1 Tax=unclassified Candidatus Desulforudis TaxID=2635950 RepID=UPI0034878E40